MNTPVRPHDPHRADLVLLVGVCTGARCAAVRRLATERGAADSRELIRTAVRQRRDAVMVDLQCPGLCSQGAVVTVGTAASRDGRLDWVGKPTWIASADEARRAQHLAAWIRGSAPDPRWRPGTATDPGPG